MAAILRLSKQSGNAEKGNVPDQKWKELKQGKIKGNILIIEIIEKAGKSKSFTVCFGGYAHFLNEFSLKKSIFE